MTEPEGKYNLAAVAEAIERLKKSGADDQLARTIIEADRHVLRVAKANSGPSELECRLTPITIGAEPDREIPSAL